MTTAIIQPTPFGTNEVGRRYLVDRGSYHRADKWTSTSGETITEIRFAAGKDDTSDMFIPDRNGRYHPGCACCYLGFSHTTARHAADLHRSVQNYRDWSEHVGAEEAARRDPWGAELSRAGVPYFCSK